MSKVFYKYLKDKAIIEIWWLRIGIRAGWISKPYCATHDGNYEYMSEDERKEWDEGGDPCHYAMSMLE